MALLPVSLAIIMFSLGIGLTIADFTRVFSYPKAITIGAVCQLVILPAIAFALVKMASLPPEISFGVMILAFCPGGVVSNIMTKLAGGAVALSISLTSIISLFTVVTIPFFVSFFASYFWGSEALDVDATKLGLSMFIITAAPVFCGVLMRHFLPNLTIKFEPMIVRLAAVIFALIVLASILMNWALFLKHFAMLGPLMIIMNVLLFAFGIGVAKLFNLSRDERISIALETGIQNSALGITIGSIIMASTTGIPSISLPSGVYAITSYFVAAPFILLARGVHHRIYKSLIQKAR